MSLNIKSIQKFLFKVHNKKVKILSLEGIELKGKSIKGYGYGIPLIIKYEVDGEIKKAVLETMKSDRFGHEYKADRFHNMILAFESYNKLPKHVKAIALGYFDKKGNLNLIKDFEEPFILVDFVEGSLYYLDLERMMNTEFATELDLKRCEALARYLADIHSSKAQDKMIYVRRIRELIGHGECAMGLIDNYPEDSVFLRKNELKEIEKKLIDWRWKIKNKIHRASVIHGDFHPWNIFFIKDTDFILNDRSRGEYGEPADDITALTINYIFFSIRKYGYLKGVFENLFLRFFETYLNETNDVEILSVLQPFYAWRALVIANPIWYPDLSIDTRRKIFNFIHNILETDEFNYKEVNSLLK